LSRAYQHVAGASKSRPQACECPRDRLSTKLCLVVNDIGKSLRLILSIDQIADIGSAKELIKHQRAKVAIGDKGYDVDALVEKIRVSGVTAVIVPGLNRIQQRHYNRCLYRKCSVIKRFL